MAKGHHENRLNPGTGVLHGAYLTDEGERIELSGESLQALSRELPEGYRGQIEIFNAAGFTFGWLTAHGEYHNA